ncbi:hypothetical protein ES705_49026 [subsurface metagenome]
MIKLLGEDTIVDFGDDDRGLLVRGDQPAEYHLVVPHFDPQVFQGFRGGGSLFIKGFDIHPQLRSDDIIRRVQGCYIGFLYLVEFLQFLGQGLDLLSII